MLLTDTKALLPADFAKQQRASKSIVRAAGVFGRLQEDIPPLARSGSFLELATTRLRFWPRASGGESINGGIQMPRRVV